VDGVEPFKVSECFRRPETLQCGALCHFVMNNDYGGFVSFLNEKKISGAGAGLSKVGNFRYIFFVQNSK
jgi:hypothetical protein